MISVDIVLTIKSPDLTLMMRHFTYFEVSTIMIIPSVITVVGNTTAFGH